MTNQRNNNIIGEKILVNNGRVCEIFIIFNINMLKNSSVLKLNLQKI